MSTGQMDEASRAMCYALRNPGKGQKPVKLKNIRKLLRKKDGKSKPTLQAISLAANIYKVEKQKRGRKVGQRATTKAEDKTIMKYFHQLRPPGHGIDSNALKRRLPKKLKKKVSRKTVIRRLAEKGFGAGWIDGSLAKKNQELFMVPSLALHG